METSRVEAPRASAEGAIRVGAGIKALKAPRGGVLGRANFSVFELKNASFGAFWDCQNLFLIGLASGCFGQQPSRGDRLLPPAPVDPSLRTASQLFDRYSFPPLTVPLGIGG